MKIKSEYLVDENYDHLLLKNFPAAVIVIDSKGLIEAINPKAEDMFGYEKGELVNHSINSLVPLDFREHHQMYLESSSLSTSKILGMTREIVGLKKSGEKFPVKIEISDFKVGTEKKFIGLIFDILKWTDLNSYAPTSQYALSEVSRQLLESEAKYKTLFDKSEDPMWVIIDGHFSVCNDSSVKILGYNNKEELKNTHPSELSPEFQADGRASFEKADAMMTRALKNGYHRFEWLHKRKNGEVFPVEVSLTHIQSDSKESLFCVWRDISKRKQVEYEILKARDEAQAASQAKSDFLALMSHELRTPLNAILGYSELLALKIAGPLNEKQEDMLKDIHIGADILYRLVSDLLQMTDIERGTLDVTLASYKVSSILSHAVPLVASLIKTVS
jgi:PAS domain S-box-containing protein